MIKLDKLFDETVVLELSELTYISDFRNSLCTQYWLNNLSTLNLGEAAKQVFITLLELRHLDCEDFIRFELLSRISPAIFQLCSALQKQYIHQSILETLRDQQIAQLVLEIRTLLALIYYDIFSRDKQSSHFFNFAGLNLLHQKRVQQLKIRSGLLALSNFTKLMHGLYSLYLDVPKNFWLCAYSIYMSAQAQKILDKKIPIRKTQLEIYTIEEGFKQLILLNILNTHKLSPTESSHLMQCIPYWLQLVNIGHTATEQSKYVINYSKSKAPAPILNQNTNEPQSLYIGLEALKKHIYKTIGKTYQYNSQNEEINLTTSLKFHILSILNEKNIRKNTRYNRTGKLDILFGISTAHFYLSNCKKFIDTLQLAESTYTEILQLQSKQAQSNTPAKISNAYEKQQPFESHSVHRVNIVNRSAGGLCLHWLNFETSHLRTGCFILTRENQNDPWCGGIIRWIKSIDHKNVQLGIELLRKQMISPAAVKILSTGQKQIYQPALILTNVDNDYTIILESSQIYYEHQKLVLRLAQEEVNIVLKTGLILTSNCAQFGFSLQQPSNIYLLKRLIEYKAYNS